MQPTVTAEQTIQEWGNGLAVRITAPVARAANFALGLPVRVEMVEEGVLLRTLGQPRLTLAQKLKVFDLAVHGGEVMHTKKPLATFNQLARQGTFRWVASSGLPRNSPPAS